MDGEEKIEQKVIVSGDAQTGNITLIGKIVYVVKNPALWQDAIWGFLSKHRYFLLAWAVLQALLAWGWLSFRNLYLIPLALWGLAAVLLTGVAWGVYSLIWLRPTRTGLVLTLLLAFGLAGLLGWQTRRILSPPAFNNGVFGILFSELGEGADFRRTLRVREISDQVYEHLCQVLRTEFASETGQDPCSQAGKMPSGGRVQLQRAGVISSPEMALAYGKKVHAEVVIWGNVLVSQEGKAAVRFQVLETPDQVMIRDFPVVLPVTTASTELFTSELNLVSDPADLKEVVGQESTLISSVALGLAAFSVMDYPHAADRFEVATDLVEKSGSLNVSAQGKSLLYFYAGRANLYMGRIDRGIAQLKTANQAYPQEPADVLSLASAYNTQGKETEKTASLLEAGQLLQDWLATHPDDARATFDRGILHLVEEKPEDAILDFQRTLELNPDFYIADVLLGQTALTIDRLDLAEQALKEALRLAEKTGAIPTWAHIDLGLVFEKAGKAQSARTEYLAAIRLAPGSYWPYVYYGSFLEKQGEMDAALVAYQKMVDLAWNKGWAYGWLGDFYRRRGLLTAALENYRRAVHETPSNSLVRTYLAETYNALGDAPSALREFQAAADLNEPIPYVFSSYAQALFKQADFAGAAQMFERALALQPLDESVMLNLGQTYEQLGQVDKAKELYTQIIKMGDRLPQWAVDIARQRLAILGVVSP